MVMAFGFPSVIRNPSWIHEIPDIRCTMLNVVSTTAPHPRMVFAPFFCADKRATAAALQVTFSACSCYLAHRTGH